MFMQFDTCPIARFQDDRQYMFAIRQKISHQDWCRNVLVQFGGCSWWRVDDTHFVTKNSTIRSLLSHDGVSNAKQGWLRAETSAGPIRKTFVIFIYCRYLPMSDEYISQENIGNTDSLLSILKYTPTFKSKWCKRIYCWKLISVLSQIFCKYLRVFIHVFMSI